MIKAKVLSKQEFFSFNLKRIEHNCRQVLPIILEHAEPVSWCTQLVISTCEHADIIPYSDQHIVALLISPLTWL